MTLLSKKSIRLITSADWIETGWRIAVLILMEVGGVFLIFPHFPMPSGLIIWVSIVFGVLVWLIQWHAKNFAYSCPKCKSIFSISPWRDVVTLHGLDRAGAWYYLKCPKCTIWSKCRIMRRKYENY